MSFAVGNVIARDPTSSSKPAEYDRDTGTKIVNFADNPSALHMSQMGTELIVLGGTIDRNVYRLDDVGNNLGILFDFPPFDDQGAFAIHIDNSSRVVIPGDPKVKRFSNVGALELDVDFIYLETWIYGSGSFGTGWNQAGGVCVSPNGRYVYYSGFLFIGPNGFEHLAIYRLDLETGEILTRFTSHQSAIFAHGVVLPQDAFQYHAMICHPSTGNLYVLEQSRTFERFGPFSAQGETAHLYLSEYDGETGELLNSWWIYSTITVPFAGNITWTIGQGIGIDGDGANVWIHFIPNDPPFTTKLYKINTSTGEATEISSDLYSGLTHQLSDYLWIYRTVVAAISAGVIAEMIMMG